MAGDGYGSSEKPVSMSPFETIVEINFPSRAAVCAIKFSGTPQNAGAAVRAATTGGEWIGFTETNHPIGLPVIFRRPDPDIITTTEVSPPRLPTHSEWETSLKGWFVGVNNQSNPKASSKTMIYNLTRLREVYGYESEIIFDAFLDPSFTVSGAVQTVNFRAWRGKGKFVLTGVNVDFIANTEQKVKKLVDKSQVFPTGLFQTAIIRYNYKKELTINVGSG